MEKKRFKRNLVLGILFFLPVAFLLLLLPATHNYQPLDIVNDQVVELDNFASDVDEPIKLADHITVLGIIGDDPKAHAISVSNLKELIYDKFRGFKKFQIVLMVTPESKDELEEILTDISPYEDLEYLHVVSANPSTIKGFFNGLKSEIPLDNNYSLANVFIVDKERNQRGRISDEIRKGESPHSLWSYNTLEIAEMKNKMSEDMRVLFTEYRQKRKGEFNSDIRRAEDLNSHD